MPWHWRCDERRRQGAARYWEVPGHYHRRPAQPSSSLAVRHAKFLQHRQRRSPTATAYDENDDDERRTTNNERRRQRRTLTFGAHSVTVLQYCDCNDFDAMSSTDRNQRTTTPPRSLLQRGFSANSMELCTQAERPKLELFLFVLRSSVLGSRSLIDSQPQHHEQPTDEPTNQPTNDCVTASFSPFHPTSFIHPFKLQTTNTTNSKHNGDGQLDGSRTRLGSAVQIFVVGCHLRCV